MMGYFKPLRHKFGVMTLLMACVFSAGWVRSLLIADTLDISSGRFRRDNIISLHASICWIRDDDKKPHNQFIHWYTGRHPARNYHETEAAALDTPEHRFPAHLPMELHSSFASVENEWYYWGFATFDCIRPSPSTLRTRVLAVPYWSLVVPLTLLSACLLLSKPRAKIEPPITPASENA
jgi:hypothetical protein